MNTNKSVVGPFALGLAIVATLAFAPLFQTSFAHKGASGVVKERMDAMKEMKVKLKEIRQMLEGKQAYSAKKINKALDTLRDHGGASMSNLFPKGSALKPSEADPAIWENWSAFKEMAVSLNHSIVEFRARLPASTDMGRLNALQKEALKIRKTCKNCHDRFRL